MKYFIIVLLAIITLDGFAQQKANSGHEVKIVRFEELEKVLNKNDDKLYVVNFWATWCRPCVLELPEFMEVNKAYRNNQHFKMILISLDMAKDAKTLVRPFLIKNKIDVDVYLLDDNKRMNEWIPAIDKSWSGAIPATVFYKNGKKLEFIESQLNKNELEQIINKYL
jgi:thiol-disulfide isomerase/thioredoxin